jgi:cephalosporin hydroxylase
MHSLRRLLRFPTTPLKKCVHDPAINVHCREFEVDNWAISRFLVETLVPIVGVHPFPLNELVLMAAAVCRLKPEHIVEWGTHLGKSARVFYETARHFELMVEIHSVDLPDDSTHQEHPGRQRGMLVTGLERVHLYQGDGLTVCRDISARIGPSSRMLVFIDGDHQYDSVMRELTGVMESVPQAHILLHDTFFQSAESGYNVGPHQAIVDALAVAPRRYRVLSSQTGLPGMTLLYQLSY